MTETEYAKRKTFATTIKVLEEHLFNALPDNDVCGCEEPDFYYKIHHGNLFNEIHAYCLKCGGLGEGAE